MVKYKLLCLWLMFTSFGHIFAQSSAKTKALTFREFQILKKKHKQSDDDCINTAKYTVAQRLRMYPFSKAIKVIGRIACS